jgi:hypothetical protein
VPRPRPRLVSELGEGNWSMIARRLNAVLDKASDTGRIGKQCRERYNHHLRPDIKKDAWTEHEEHLFVQAHLRFGNRWSDIAKIIPGRTENQAKNHVREGGRGGSMQAAAVPAAVWQMGCHAQVDDREPPRERAAPRDAAMPPPPCCSGTPPSGARTRSADAARA